jgi:hypothetical protein
MSVVETTTNHVGDDNLRDHYGSQPATGREKAKYWLSLTSAERDLLLVSTVIKLLLFPT